MTLTIPEGVDVGQQYIPCTVTLQTPGDSSKTVRSINSLDLVGAQATVPDVMTYGFVAFMVDALVSMPVFMRKRQKA